jgi:hypothetical protein
MRMHGAARCTRVCVGQHVLDLRCSDAKGKRPKSTMRRGMAVATHDRHARKRQSLLGPHDVDYAVIWTGQVKVRDAEITRVLHQRFDLNAAGRFGDTVSSIRCLYVVVGNRDAGAWTANRAASKSQSLEGLWTRYLGDQVPVDVQEIGVRADLVNEMVLPDLLEHRAGRCCHALTLV